MNQLPKTAIDSSYLDHYLSDGGYEITGGATVETYFLKNSDFDIRIQKDMPVLGIASSDYNDLLKLSGHEEITLSQNQFAIAWDHKALSSEIEAFNQQHTQIQAE